MALNIKKKKISEMPLLEATTENTYVHVIDSGENYKIEANKLSTELPVGTVIDTDYVHTDNNYTDLDKLEVAKIAGKANQSTESTWDPSIAAPAIADVHLAAYAGYAESATYDGQGNQIDAHYATQSEEEVYDPSAGQNAIADVHLAANAGYAYNAGSAAGAEYAGYANSAGYTTNDQYGNQIDTHYATQSELQNVADEVAGKENTGVASTLITQLIDGATDNTLKKLQDKILAINAIIGGNTPDGDNIVNTVAELLSVFSTFPEGSDMVTLLTAKLNTSDVYNALDRLLEGKALDARQGKILKDLCDGLRTDLTNHNHTLASLSDVNLTGDTTPLDTDSLLIQSGTTVKKTLFSTLKTFLANTFGALATTNTWSLGQTFTSWVKTSKIIPNGTTLAIRNQADNADLVVVDIVNNQLVLNGYNNTFVNNFKLSNTISGNTLQFALGSNSSRFAFGTLTNHSLSLFTANSYDNFRLTTNGDVAIGGQIVNAGNDFTGAKISIKNNFIGLLTATPETTLDINGDTTSRGWIYLNNGTHTGDAVGDRRTKVVNDVEVTERCNITNAAVKGSSVAGAWLPVSNQLSDNTVTASAAVEGCTRYRKDVNNSYIETCMQTGASTYQWVVTKQITW